jgi:hypothetical protein
MAATRPLRRTVAFWRLINAADNSPMAQIDWPTFAAAVDHRARNGRSRHTIDDAEITGRIYTRDENDHLVLTRNRDDLPRQQNRATGDVADMATTGEEWSVIESSFIAFLRFGNVFGLLQSQNTAPSPQAIAKWINSTELLGDTKVAVEAVVDPSRWQLLREAGSVSLLEFSAASTVLDQPVTGPLNYLLGPARIGNVKVSVKVNAGRSRTSTLARQQRRTLYRAVEELALRVGAENLDHVKVTTFDEDMSGLKAGSVDLLKQRFTMKAKIRLSSGTNSSVSELSAFDAIMAAVEKFGDGLRIAVRDDLMD